MIDGIKIFIPESQLSTFKTDKLVQQGPTLYRLFKHEQNHNQLKLNFKRGNRGLYIEGSLMYAINGNTFEPVSMEGVKHFLKELSVDIGVDVFKGAVQYFEFGTVVESTVPFKAFMAQHVGIPGMRLCKNDPHFVVYGNKTRSVKMYNAGYRLSMVHKDIRKSLLDRGIFKKGKHYLKFEIVYKEPQKCLTNPATRVEDLFKDELLCELKDDLLLTYKSIYRTGLNIDKTKGIGLETIVYATLKKMEVEVEGLDVNTKIRETLDEFKAQLGPQTKYRHKKRIEKLIEQVKLNSTETDIYDRLEEKVLQQITNGEDRELVDRKLRVNVTE